jgi:hypothetical protein
MAFATAVAGISMPLQLIRPSSVTPNPFSRRKRTTRLWDGESAKSWMISDHILTTGKYAYKYTAMRFRSHQWYGIAAASALMRSGSASRAGIGQNHPHKEDPVQILTQVFIR